VDGMPEGLGAPDQVEKIVQISTRLSGGRIYAPLASHTGEHLREETKMLV